MTTATKERPILFSGPMVQAILAGRKTATRRIIKPQPAEGLEMCPYSSTGWALKRDGGCSCRAVAAPFGIGGGMRLWVRETWGLAIPAGASIHADRVPHYAATDAPIPGGWKPSIHMPRALSRIMLEITGVRVERLHEIAEEDAIREGVGPGYVPNSLGSTTCVGHRPMFVRIWNEINGPGAWDANPWVWVVEFRRVTPAES
jgi:hypothetical protein